MKEIMLKGRKIVRTITEINEVLESATLQDLVERQKLKKQAGTTMYFHLRGAKTTCYRKDVMSDGDGKAKQCSNCGEPVYLLDEDDVKLCPKCGDVIFCFAKRD